MSPLEAPLLEDLREMGLDAEWSGPTSMRLTAIADDDDRVCCEWDVDGRSVQITWSQGAETIAVIQREHVSTLTVNVDRGVCRVRVVTRADELTGELVLFIGRAVSIEELLRES